LTVAQADDKAAPQLAQYESRELARVMLASGELHEKAQRIDALPLYFGEVRRTTFGLRRHTCNVSNATDRCKHPLHARVHVE
jgi:hypothetical protein